MKLSASYIQQVIWPIVRLEHRRQWHFMHRSHLVLYDMSSLLRFERGRFFEAKDPTRLSLSASQEMELQDTTGPSWTGMT